FYVYEYLTCIGIANSCGKIVVPLDCKYPDVRTVRSEDDSHFSFAYGSKNGKYHFFTMTGEPIFSSEYMINEKYGDFYLGEKTNLSEKKEFALLNKNGEACITSDHPIEYMSKNIFNIGWDTIIVTDGSDDATLIDNYVDSVNNDRLFCIKDPDTEKYGLRDRKGTLITDCIFDSPIVAKQDSLYLVKSYSYNKITLIDKKQNTTTENIESYFFAGDNLFVTINTPREKNTFKVENGKLHIAPHIFLEDDVVSVGDKSFLIAEKDGKTLCYDTDFNLINENSPLYQKYLADKTDTNQTSVNIIQDENGIWTVYDSNHQQKKIKANTLEQYGKYWIAVDKKNEKTAVYDSNFNLYWEIPDLLIKNKYISENSKINSKKDYVLRSADLIYSLYDKKIYDNSKDFIKSRNSFSEEDLKKFEKSSTEFHVEYDTFYKIISNPILNYKIVKFIDNLCSHAEYFF
ncbi:MAG: hypothetical protein KBT47_04935, partial [Armatimonadetes bacterium]|nr:hypothetical protein [Candidatus Hippobium faecium]